MGSNYVIGQNPFQDYLFKSIEFGVNIADTKMKADIRTNFVYILEYVLDNPNDSVYLDFDIIEYNNHIKVLGKNAISSLWLSGIFPRDVDAVKKSNVFVIGNRKYHYNKKTKLLTYTIIND